MLSLPASVSECVQAVHLPRLSITSFICLFVHTDIVITVIFHEQLEHSRYSVAPTYDLIRFWKSKVKFSAGH